ncbi:phosphoribosylglycinamide formyltransferase [Pararhizobium mangrovi]|uniref:Phosphoribosylglycinamide formyltransferase n=1 Tax=Pararhizobium mangrovi TaxID=2590452 RepID=A0A506UFK5_9HYPH|nr:phosphoribosylglycinamide formyltransferase [Pararhizobium mangrovi]TPW32071.1 phosphoribosylglycinamide formyltransferase [Pararhizobium mangrovi]
MTAKRVRVAVLISGRGSNMAALLAAAGNEEFPAHIAVVIADRADAAGLATADAAGIPAMAVPRRDYSDKAAHEAAIEAQLHRHDIDLVCLAGFMRLLSGAFVARWQGRILNIHPSLLPLFPGLDTHARALAAGVRLHGCSVHFVTEGMDEGPIVAQAAVPVECHDTAQTLSERVLAAEHRLYPAALHAVANGSVRLDPATGRSVFSADPRERAMEEAILFSGL